MNGLTLFSDLMGLLLDKERCKEGIEWFYKFMGYENLLSFLGSPMACHLAVNEIVETPITGFYVDNLNFPTSPIFFNYPDAIQPVRWAVSESFHSILYNIESIFDSIFYYTIMNELENKEIPMYGVETIVILISSVLVQNMIIGLG